MRAVHKCGRGNVIRVIRHAESRVGGIAECSLAIVFRFFLRTFFLALISRIFLRYPYNRTQAASSIE